MSAPAPTGTVRIEAIASRLLEGNPLGDPAVRQVPVWLPPSYATSPDRRYPVIYWLAGFTGDGRTLFSWNPWTPGLGERLDALVGSGAMGEVIVVAPDAFTRLGGSQYLDSPAHGPYQRHITDELIPAIDRRFRTVASRDGRGVGGKSSGGYGALRLAMQRPDLFSALACHAGDCYFELSILPDVAKVVRNLRRRGGIDGFLAHFAAAPKKSSDDVSTIMMLAVAAAYAPDGTRPHGFALPFDLETGAIDAAVWQRFKAHDPVELVAHHAEALRQMRWIYFDAGTRDEWALDLGTRIVVQRLRALGIPCEHEEFDDGHMGTAYRYDVSLPRMARALGASPP